MAKKVCFRCCVGFVSELCRSCVGAVPVDEHARPQFGVLGVGGDSRGRRVGLVPTATPTPSTPRSKNTNITRRLAPSKLDGRDARPRGARNYGDRAGTARATPRTDNSGRAQIRRRWLACQSTVLIGGQPAPPHAASVPPRQPISILC